MKALVIRLVNYQKRVSMYYNSCPDLKTKRGWA